MASSRTTARHKPASAEQARATRFDRSRRWAVTSHGMPFLVFHQYTRGFAIRTAVLLRFGCFLDFMLGKAVLALRDRLGLGPKWKPFWKS